MNYPRLREIGRQRLWTEQFLGLDRRPRTYDGAFCAMGNMTGDPWPLISTRKPRTLTAELNDPQGMIALEKLAWIDGGTLYYGGEPTAITNLSLAENMLPKRMAAMGAYILIFPDKVYYNTVKPEDHGSIERLWESEGDVSYTLCAMDGVNYPEGSLTASDTAPEEPEDGDYWLDTSGDTHALYQWLDEWVGVSTVYVKISAPGIGEGLKTQDSVTVSGIRYTGENETLGAQLEMLNETHVVQAVGVDYIVVIGIIDQQYTQESGTVRADRKMPSMDHVIASGNRLWGCRYGEEDGEMVNRIYASALGDFRNWQKYQGTSQDSYYVNVGTDGPFTGAAEHRGSPYFFKANCVHKIFGEKPSNYQAQAAQCEGVRPGCAGTLAGYNGYLFYVGNSGPQRYETLPEAAGKALGDAKMLSGTAGICGDKYYLSAEGSDGEWDLYTLDMERGIWHREDDSRALAFAALDGDMYMLLKNGLLWKLGGGAETFTWYAETAEMGYEYPEHKYLSRVLVRMKLGEKTDCDISIQYDGDGIWRHKGRIEGTGKVHTYLLPVIPRRCDRLRIRIEGHGEAQIYGIARELAAGSDA